MALAPRAASAQQGEGAQGAQTTQASQLDRARAAYDRGAAAFDRGDWAAALDDLERADALVPNAVTLELALKASLHGDDPLRAMALVDRADERGGGGSLAATADQVRRTFDARTGRLTVVCPVPRSCTAAFDGAPFDLGASRRVLAGDHTLVLVVDGKRSQVPIAMQEHGAVEILASAYAPLPPAPPSADPNPPATPRKPESPATASPGGLPPLVFWLGVGATAVLAGVTTASAIDTTNKHSDYSAGRSTSAADGIAAQTRTNVLLAVTGGVAVATACLGLFAVRWGARKSSSSGSNALVLSGASVAFERTF